MTCIPACLVALAVQSLGLVVQSLGLVVQGFIVQAVMVFVGEVHLDYKFSLRPPQLRIHT